MAQLTSSSSSSSTTTTTNYILILTTTYYILHYYPTYLTTTYSFTVEGLFFAVAPGQHILRGMRTDCYRGNNFLELGGRLDGIMPIGINSLSLRIYLPLFFWDWTFRYRVVTTHV